MSVRVILSDDEVVALERTAAKEGRSPEEVSRTAIIEYISGWRRERERLLEEIFSHDTKVLRRLGNA